MSRFARTTEEVFLRRKELIDKERKQGYQETLLLYQIILLHSWATGVCDKTLPELCAKYSLDIDNSYRRLKILREKSWVQNTDKYIRPLLIHRPAKNGVNSTPEFGVKITVPTVKITAADCKNYSEINENTVKITAENPPTADSQTVYGDAKTSFKFKPALEATTTEHETEVVVAVSDEKNNKSQLSIEEISHYVEICIERGQTVKNPRGLVLTLLQTGEADDFIRAMLYPAAVEFEGDAAEYDKNGFAIPKPLDDEQKRHALDIAHEYAENGFDLNGIQQFYTPADWTWMMGELNAANAG